MKRMLGVVVILLIFMMVNSGYCADFHERITQLEKMYKEKLITKGEYKTTRQKILREMSSGDSVTNNKRSAIKPSKEALIAVIPFYGKVYSDGDRDTIAKFSVDNLRQYIVDQEIKQSCEILDFHEAKQIMVNSLGILDPGEPYTNEQLKTISRILGTRYLAFGKINHMSFENNIHRFNVECQVFDAEKGKVIFKKQARQSSARKFFNLLLPERGKSFGKISEQFYFFIDELTGNKRKIIKQEDKFKSRLDLNKR
jgi:hypothetical protein